MDAKGRSRQVVLVVDQGMLVAEGMYPQLKKKNLTGLQESLIGYEKLGEQTLLACNVVNQLSLLKVKSELEILI